MSESSSPGRATFHVVPAAKKDALIAAAKPLRVVHRPVCGTGPRTMEVRTRLGAFLAAEAMELDPFAGDSTAFDRLFGVLTEEGCGPFGMRDRFEAAELFDALEDEWATVFTAAACAEVVARIRDAQPTLGMDTPDLPALQLLERWLSAVPKDGFGILRVA